MPQYMAPIMLVAVAVYVLGRLWQIRRSRNFWVQDMQRCAGIPHTRDKGGGWSECTCTNCYKVFLWYDEDECICTNCGVHYWKQDTFERPIDD
jgi:hypothetical protein